MTTTPLRDGTFLPLMPARSPKALRAAIAQHTPQLLVGFDRHWRRDIADAYDLAPVPAVMARWWSEYALARAKALIDKAGHIRRSPAKAKPGQ